jgi:hypothetical protein
MITCSFDQQTEYRPVHHQKENKSAEKKKSVRPDFFSINKPGNDKITIEIKKSDPEQAVNDIEIKESPDIFQKDSPVQVGRRPQQIRKGEEEGPAGEMNQIDQPSSLIPLRIHFSKVIRPLKKTMFGQKYATKMKKSYTNQELVVDSW